MICILVLISSQQAERDNDDETPRTKSARKSVNMTPEQRARVDRIDLRCLSLCQRMLERVKSVRLYFSTISIG